MTTRVVGVDIGSTTLRAVEVENPGKAKPTVTRYHEVALPEGAVRRGEVVEVNTVVTALRRLWSEGRFSTKDVVMGIGGQSIIARDLSVPRAPIERIRESLPFRVQELLPVPVADAVLDFYPVEEDPDSGGTAVKGLLVAAITQAVMANVDTAAQAGLTTREMDLIPFALSRASSGDDAGRFTVLLDVGASTSNVVIGTGGVPYFVRIIPAGGDDVTRALMTRLELQRDDAEATKRRVGLTAGAGPEDRPALEVVYGVTGELLTSIRNTLAYFANSRSGVEFARIVVTGGGSRLRGFGEALGELTRLPVVGSGLPAQVALGRRVAPRAEDPALDGMTVALGLALGRAA